jgi:GT2 family glycosyltransferase
MATSPSPSAGPAVRLVVLNWNGREHLGRCLAALRALDWPAERLDLVVVDNASTDGSDALAASTPGVRLVRNDHNGGFVAVNLALRDLDGVDYVGLVNTDSFVEPGWLRALVAALEADERRGAATARLLMADRFAPVDLEAPTFVPGRGDRRRLGVRVAGARVGGADRWSDAQFAAGDWGIEHGRDGGTYRWTGARASLLLPVTGGGDAPGARLLLSAERAKPVTVRSGGTARTVEVGPEARWVEVALTGPGVDVVNNAGSIVYDDGYGADRGFLEPDDGQYDEPAEVFAWSGGSVLLRPAYLRDVGLFDEHFFLYYEDTDLSWRGRSRGWRHVYVPGAVARHVHAASTGVGSATFMHYTERNRLLMLARNAPARMVLGAVGRYGLVTLSYARRDVVAPLLRGRRPQATTVARRLRSFAGFVALVPAALRARRGIRRRATVDDGLLLAGLVPRRPA